MTDQDTSTNDGKPRRAFNLTCNLNEDALADLQARATAAGFGSIEEFAHFLLTAIMREVGILGAVDAITLTYEKEPAGQAGDNPDAGYFCETCGAVHHGGPCEFDHAARTQRQQAKRGESHE